MTDLNHGVCFGHIVRQPDVIKKGAANVSILTFTLAVNRDYKAKGKEEWNEKTSFIDFTLFGNRAEAMQSWLTKGKPINVEYHLEQERWTDKEGKKASRLKAVPDKVYAFIERSGQKGKEDKEENEVSSVDYEEEKFPDNYDFLDELPLQDNIY